jgi:hypothetical protein
VSQGHHSKPDPEDTESGDSGALVPVIPTAWQSLTVLHEQSRDRDAWNGLLRRPIPFLLAPLTLLLMAIASRFGGLYRQPLILCLGSAAILGLCFLIRLPPEAQTAWDERWQARFAAHWRVVAFVGLLVLASASVIALANNGGVGLSAATVAFAASAGAYALALGVYEVAAFSHPKSRGVTWFVGAMSALWPLVALLLLPVLFEQPSILIVIATALLPPVGVWFLTRIGMLRKRPAAAGRRSQDFRLLQMSLLVVSGILLVGAALRIPVERRPLGTTELAAFPSMVDAPPTLADAIERYTPILRFNRDERWYETSVEHFSSVAKSTGVSGACFAHAKGDPCKAMSDPEAGLTGTAVESPHQNSGLLPDGVAYPLVQRLGDKERATLGAGMTSSTDPTTYIVEYWLFYPFDLWHAGTALGGLDQTHEGDWEFVAVGLRKSLLPSFVAYSEHCTGIWRPWSQTPVVAIVDGIMRIGLRDNATHPFVVVAGGSHANYPTTGTREPEWAGCPLRQYQRTASALQFIGFAANAREATSDTGPIERLSTPVARPCQVSPSTTAAKALCNRWFWGKFETYRLGTPLGDGVSLLPAHATGPASPAFQDPGRNAAATIGTWRRDTNVALLPD